METSPGSVSGWWYVLGIVLGTAIGLLLIGGISVARLWWKHRRPHA